MTLPPRQRKKRHYLMLKIMDLKKLFTIIIIIGASLLAFGSIQLLINSPKQFDRSKSEQTMFGRNDLGNLLDVSSENYQRKQKRRNATTILIIGGIILIIGGILKANNTQKSTADNIVSSNTQNLDQNDYQYCTNCGARVRKGDQCNNCNPINIKLT